MRRIILHAFAGITTVVVASGAASSSGSVQEWQVSRGSGTLGSAETVAGESGRIVFARQRWDSNAGVPKGIKIYVMNADGSGQRRLSPGTTMGADQPAWSPDGRKIALSRSDSPPSPDSQVYVQIFVMNADGSGQRNLTRSGDGDNDAPAWSPDGRKIAFAGWRWGSDGNLNTQIFVMNADGSGRQRLTRRTTDDDSDPAWSPDGRTIAFTRDRVGKDGKPRGYLYLMNADGSGQRRLATAASSPAWSPDGGRIAFTRMDRGYAQIYLMNADGSGQRNLTRSTGRDSNSPAWSPDGRKIAFSGGTRKRDEITTNPDIYVMNADGSSQRSLTPNKAYFDYHPGWSPAPR